MLEHKNKGFLTAAERDGSKVDFADFGNSPTVFLNSRLNGKELAYSTTNGTQAVELAKSNGRIAVVSFANLQAVGKWLSNQQLDILILCSGWKNTVSLEDTLCAGALVELLELTGKFAGICDSSYTALTLWQASKNKLSEVVKQANHYKRLLTLGQQTDLEHCFLLNSSAAVPVWDGRGFRDASVG